MRTYMKPILASLVLAAGIHVASAQDVVIAPEQETVIREYVRSKPIASIDLPGVELNIGSTVPETVELHRIEKPDVAYSYTVVGDRTVIVDPGTRKIIKVYD